VTDEAYDVVIVGAGVAGSLVAKRLTTAGLRVLVLEAGPATAAQFDDYTRRVRDFYGALTKSPESPWTPALGAPQPDTRDLRSGDGYFIQAGPQPYASTYTRLQGGSTLHWLGVCLRMLPEDFEMRTRYGVGRDWPLSYADLEPWYREAEFELGVAGDVAEQAYLGVEFAPGYDYPMHRIPPSYSDMVLASAVDGVRVAVGGGEEVTLKVRSYPAARNSVPRGGYRPVGAVDERENGQALARNLGQRCAGNSSCTPICPIQAKYNALKSLAQAEQRNLEVVAQAVASRVQIDPTSGQVVGIEYQRYENASSSRHTVHVARARAYVLAAHAVENAKLMLASLPTDEASALGRNLMDHPSLYAWGLAERSIGAYRGPLSTSGIDSCRGGKFRARHGGFRVDVGNDGWRACAGGPDTTVLDAVTNLELHGSALRQYLASGLPRQVRFSLNVEQLPSPANRVTIAPDHRDALGNPRPVINYAIDDYTLAGLATARRFYQEVFRRAGVEDHSDRGNGSWFPTVEYKGDTFQYHGMGHFAGTHVMGQTSADSVVDPDQRSWAHRNLFMMGAGSFPTMGTSNPTLTLAALALRSAHRLAQELSR